MNEPLKMKILIREIRPWNDYYLCSDGTFWKDRLLTIPVKSNYRKRLRGKKLAERNKTTPEPFWEDFDTYNCVGFNCMQTPVHRTMKQFLHNPVPTGKFYYNMLDHIRPEHKAWNSTENLRFTNAHLNALNKNLVSDIYYDRDIRMWGAQFSTRCRTFKYYHAGFATCFTTIWKLYKQKRIQAYNEWNEYYISLYNKRNGVPKNKKGCQTLCSSKKSHSKKRETLL
jgi:hypothetical protein